MKNKYEGYNGQLVPLDKTQNNLQDIEQINKQNEYEKLRVENEIINKEGYVEYEKVKQNTLMAKEAEKKLE